VAAAIIALVVLGSAAAYLRFSPYRTATRGPDPDAQDASSQASDQPALTAPKVESAPPIASPPDVSSTPPVSTPPSSPPARPPVSVAPPAPAPPVRSGAPPANDGAGQRTPPRSTAAESITKPQDTASAEPTPAAPVPAAPAAAPGSPPVSVPVPAPPTVPAPRPSPAASASARALTVRHLHARSLRRGFARGSCDGDLQLLSDGLHFETTSSSDGRLDDKRVTFKDIEEFEIDENRIRIETEEQAWEFSASADVLDLIQQHIKTNKKD
jgi:hypothetical protein